MRTRAHNSDSSAFAPEFETPPPSSIFDACLLFTSIIIFSYACTKPCRKYIIRSHSPKDGVVGCYGSIGPPGASGSTGATGCAGTSDSTGATIPEIATTLGRFVVEEWKSAHIQEYQMFASDMNI